MLRRKLMLMLGLLVALLAIVSIVALVLLQGVLRDLKRIDNQAWAVVERVNHLGVALDDAEAQMRTSADSGVASSAATQAVAVNSQAAVQLVRGAITQLEAHAGDLNECKSLCDEIHRQLADFEGELREMDQPSDPATMDAQARHIIEDAAVLRRQALQLSWFARTHADREHQAVVDKFRWVLLGLGVAFLVLINAASVVLIRAAVIVLRPIDQLIEASRMLAHDRFEYRVRIQAHDEFYELAQAFNALAERLQENEKRRVEVLAQTALTLNHELNNAMAIIELRLHPLARQASGNAGMEKCLREIRENLGRMARTVESIKHVRRIVLTDYVSGVKMLDLERSVQAADA
jgi:nitrate/nitrite-specific signal transduction histidine kinase